LEAIRRVFGPVPEKKFFTLPTTHTKSRESTRLLAYLITIFTLLTHLEYLIMASVFDGLCTILFIAWEAFDREVVPLDA
jgi:hypothetical protein